MFQIVLDLDQLKIDRATVMSRLKERNIGTGVHYPLITGFKLYQDLGYQTSHTPIAQRIGKSILTLPLFPSMSPEDVIRVVIALKDALIGP